MFQGPHIIDDSFKFEEEEKSKSIVTQNEGKAHDLSLTQQAIDVSENTNVANVTPVM